MKMLNNLESFYELKIGDICYIKNENLYVHVYSDCIYFTDLTNAMKHGKECSCSVMYSLEKGKSPIYTLINFIDDLEITTFWENVRNGIYLNRPALESFGLEFKTMILKSKRVFSPFVTGKNQDVEKINKINQVVQAILAGQVKEIVCEGYYTDDYAYDAAVNFNKGHSNDLLCFAKKLTEEPNSWALLRRNNTICLVNGSFDYERVVFK